MQRNRIKRTILLVTAFGRKQTVGFIGFLSTTRPAPAQTPVRFDMKVRDDFFVWADR